MDSKPVQKPRGRRPVSKDGDDSTWEWTVEDGLDTDHLKALAEGLAIKETPREQNQPEAAGLDPYNKGAEAVISPADARAKRRTLDDMRRLSDEIKLTRKEQKR